MKIGILGGTFNPIHYGHLILGEQVLGQLKLDRVIFVPTFMPPHKSNKDVITASHRLKMIELAVYGNPHFAVSDIDAFLSRPDEKIPDLKTAKKWAVQNTQDLLALGLEEDDIYVQSRK